MQKKIEQDREKGYRPVVVACMIRDQKILMGFKKEFGQWEIPQGGIDNNEDVVDTFVREMTEELGIDASRYLAINPKVILKRKRKFPKNRHGSRELTLNDGTPVVMQGKAYYVMYAYYTGDKITPKKSEFDELHWFSYAQAKRKLKTLNHGGKQKLVDTIIDLLRKKNLI